MTTPVIIDIIAAAVLIGFTACGAKRGLFRALAGLIVLILSLTGAGIIASALSEPAAKLIAPAIEERIGSRLEEAIREQFSGEALEEGLADQLSLADMLDLLGVDQSLWDALAFRTQDIIRDTGAHLMTAVIESVARSMLYGVLYMLSFAALTVVLHLLVRMLDAVLKLPVLHGLNTFGGGIAGLAEGVLLLFLAAWVLRLLGVSLNGEDGSLALRLFAGSTPLGTWSPPGAA